MSRVGTHFAHCGIGALTKIRALVAQWIEQQPSKL